MPVAGWTPALRWRRPDAASRQRHAYTFRACDGGSGPPPSAPVGSRGGLIDPVGMRSDMSIKEHGAVAAEWSGRQRPEMEERTYGKVEI